MRFFKHLFTTKASARRLFPKDAIDAITDAIEQSEKKHRAEVVFVIEASLDPIEVLQGKTGKERCIEIFAQHRVWDTEENNGVLIYLLLADHDIEILADRGVYRVAGDSYWEKLCQQIESHFRSGQFTEGVVEGIQTLTELLVKHYPKDGADPDELTNRPAII